MPYLSLVPTDRAVQRRLAGFHSGETLKIFFKSGETVHTVMHRFNEYRSPDNQIEVLYTTSTLTATIQMSSVLVGDVSLWLV